MILYHGTGYDFDRFEHRLGQGEGTHVFGNGLYVCEHHRVALHYARLVGSKTGRGIVYRVRVPFLRTDFLDWHRGGEHVYKAFVKSYGSTELASTRLSKFGTPGVSYLDRYSRQIGFGTRNFVVFDPTRVEIIDKMPISMGRVVERVLSAQPIQLGLDRTFPEPLADPGVSSD